MAVRYRIGEDPDVVFHLPCNRCNRKIIGRFEADSECFGCVQAAKAVWPELGPIRGGVSGA